MKLLFDENLSPRLVRMLGDLFPGSAAILDLDLGGNSDSAVWRLAEDQGFLVVSKDSDFLDRAIVTTGTVKLVWVRLGNCTTQAVHLVLRNSAERVSEFA